MRNSAPGIDRIRVGDVCRLKAECLAVSFTGILYCGDIPQIWKVNRTVLIRK